jgi:hypothetical protein
MGTVVVLSKDATLALINPTFVGATINGVGELVLTKSDTSTVNVGFVQDHSELLHLSADDHAQYAKTDGSRGDFATVAQGTKADAARPNTQATIGFNAGDSTSWVDHVTITNDGTSSTGWQNRIEYRYDATVGGGVGTSRLTFFLNEYGEARLVPAKHNTVALRFFTKDQPADTSHDSTVPMLEMMDDRTTRTSLWSLLPTGFIQYKDVGMNYVLVLAAAASIPSNTPANTLIVRLP